MNLDVGAGLASDLSEVKAEQEKINSLYLVLILNSR